MNKKQIQQRLSDLEGKLWFDNKEIKRLVQIREERKKEIAKLKKQLNINPQSEFII